MKVSSEFSLNCTQFKINNGNKIDIISLDSTDQDLTYKIFNQSNFLTPSNLSNWIPFIKDPELISDRFNNGLGVHCGVNESVEFLKLWIPPSGSDTLISLYGPEGLRSIIELDEDESKFHSILTFCRPSFNNSIDISLSSLHVNERDPHDDIFLGCNLKSNLLGVKKNFKVKLSVNAGVCGNTYMDRNGHLQFLGNYYDY